MTLIIVVGFNLRIGIVSIGPLIEDMRATLGMSRPIAGFLTMLPVLALGAFSVVGGRWVADRGVRRPLVVALTVLVAAILARAVAPSAALLLLATVPIGAALAVAGAALPAFVKGRFAGATGAATGTYVAALDIGAGLAALVAVPVAQALGGWRWALAVTAIPAALAIPFAAALRGRWQGPPRATRRPLTVDKRVMRLLIAIFAAQSVSFLGVITWVSPMYESAGWSAKAAGLAAAILLAGAIPAAVGAPWLSDRVGRRRLLLPFALVTTLGILGLALWPTGLPELWLPLVAFGTGALFPLALTLPLDVAPDPDTAARLAGLTVGVGYSLSALAPVVVGGLHDLTGGYEVPFVLIAGAALAIVPLAWRLDRTTAPRRPTRIECLSRP